MAVPEALDHGDGPALPVGDAVAGGGAAEPGEDAADEHGEHGAGEPGVKGELIAESEGQGEHPHGHPGEDAIDELGG